MYNFQKYKKGNWYESGNDQHQIARSRLRWIVQKLKNGTIYPTYFRYLYGPK